jgi:hypothetical protein
MDEDFGRFLGAICRWFMGIGGFVTFILLIIKSATTVEYSWLGAWLPFLVPTGALISLIILFSVVGFLIGALRFLTDKKYRGTTYKQHLQPGETWDNDWDLEENDGH